MVNVQPKARVVVTRPQPQCDEWVDALGLAGWTAIAFPLLTIGPSPHPHVVRETVIELLNDSVGEEKAPLSAVMFVSGAAFFGFVDALGPSLWAQLKARVAFGTRFWLTGPGSAKALLSAGIPIEAMDFPGRQNGSDAATDGTVNLLDSEALWAMVRSQVNATSGPHKVLLVRGADEKGQLSGNPWMATQLAGVGVQVHSVLAYQRHAPANTPDRQAIWQRATEGSKTRVWVFSSSQGMNHLPLHDWSGSRAVATHPKIAGNVRALGFSEVRVSAPDLESVIASLKSFHD